jgi:hypothetical protein
MHVLINNINKCKTFNLVMYIVNMHSYYLLCAWSQLLQKFMMNELSAEVYGIVSRDHVRGFMLMECINP